MAKGVYAVGRGMGIERKEMSRRGKVMQSLKTVDTVKDDKSSLTHL